MKDISILINLYSRCQNDIVEEKRRLKELMINNSDDVLFVLFFNSVVL